MQLVIAFLLALFEVHTTLPAGTYHVDRLPNGGARVTSKFAGVQVLLDGIVRGTAPIDLPPLGPGKHVIELRLAGY